MDPFDIALIAAIALVWGTVLASIWYTRQAARRAREEQGLREQAARELEAQRAEIAQLREGLGLLMQRATTEAALGQQRYDALAHAVASSGERADGARRETTQQLDENRRALDTRLAQMTEAVTGQLTAVRGSLDRQLADIRTDTNTQLDRMRTTVDEKLQKTLNDRITQSFALVNESLDKVGRGLGEMQSIAADVGGLKRVLAGVKTRGILGEVQLGAILAEMLAPGQYDRDVATVPGSANRVEFAVKLPGDAGAPVYLPIDAKFPADTYEHLRSALDAGDASAAEAAWKQLERRLKDEAKDIRDKYLAPPSTTTFGILFLPFEGLYAEVAGRPGLLEELQRTYRVNVAGPSTMAALLNSLQMGFQTVAIQQRASEIQTVLAAVKTEFGTYQAMLRQAQKQLGTVSRTVDTLVGTRSRAMERKLRSITELDDPAEAARILGVADDEPADGAPASKEN
ncbi:DNA recombination protein RmuC [Collinsella intestinalis]|uniref:DNA recombination protein RmuC n=1 Tax=Collinsella intestinalis TaxID=147207 RepID=UPI0025A42726|nr:DNA recombination protein RmuC [Collinsella intestinalis]MDM8164186.1 DNA recombination protein RmuC [Collinsella intestinalis]